MPPKSARFGVLGDTHARDQWAAAAIRWFADQQVWRVVQVGDFGFGYRSDFVAATHAALAATGVNLFVVPGNHDDQTIIAAMKPDRFGWLHDPQYPHLRVAPRTHEWEWDGVMFAGLAGTISPRLWRDPAGRLLWWPESAITAEDVAAVSAGPKVDVFISHDSPTFVADLPHSKEIEARVSKELMMRLMEQRDFIAAAVTARAPHALFHGHWHTYRDRVLDAPGGQRVRVVSMAKDHSPLGGAAVVTASRPGVLLLEVNPASSSMLLGRDGNPVRNEDESPVEHFLAPSSLTHPLDIDMLNR